MMDSWDNGSGQRIAPRSGLMLSQCHNTSSSRPLPAAPYTFTFVRDPCISHVRFENVGTSTKNVRKSLEQCGRKTSGTGGLQNRSTSGPDLPFTSETLTDMKETAHLDLTFQEGSEGVESNAEQRKKLTHLSKIH